MNFIKRIFIITILIIALIYTVYITNIPENIILFKNEKLEIGKIYGIVLKEEESIETSNTRRKKNEKIITVNLFNFIKVKEVKVSEIENVKVIPLGNTIGIKLYSNGVLVIGMSEVGGCKPYEKTGIKEGDLIIKVDNIEVTTTGELIECVNESKREKNRNKIPKKWNRTCSKHSASKNRRK